MSEPDEELVRTDAVTSPSPLPPQRIVDRAMNMLVRAYFTKANLLLHALIYPVLMALEGGDFHLFLDGISIEAVFVGLMVGISTKTIIAQHHGLAGTMRVLLHHVRRSGPLA